MLHIIDHIQKHRIPAVVMSVKAEGQKKIDIKYNPSGFNQESIQLRQWRKNYFFSVQRLTEPQNHTQLSTSNQDVRRKEGLSYPKKNWKKCGGISGNVLVLKIGGSLAGNV